MGDEKETPKQLSPKGSDSVEEAERNLLNKKTEEFKDFYKKTVEKYKKINEQK